MIHLLNFLPIALIGQQEMILIVLVVLILFGGTKIPQLMRGVGKGVGELQKGLEEGKRMMDTSIREEAEKKDSPESAPKA
jgi:sec-independent protein translocase protein TatA